jgi:hypothetical protein
MMRRGVRVKDAHRKLFRFSLGAFTDAADLLRTCFDLQPVLGHSALCALAFLMFIASVAGFTGGFRNTRQAISIAASQRSSQMMLLSRSARVFGIEAASSRFDLEAWQRQTARASLAGFVLEEHTLQVTDNFFEVLGEAPRTGFMFLGRFVRRVEALNPSSVKVGVLARCKECVPHELAAELTAPNGSIVTAITLGARMGEVFGVPLAVALLMLVMGMTQMRGARAGLFLFVNIALGQCAVAVVWAELIGRVSSSATGGVSFGASIVGIGLNLMTAALVLAWSLYDQKERCPQCLRRLRMPVRIGVSSSVIFEAAGVESVCPAGHGARFAPEWRGPTVERPAWTSFDDSWRDGLIKGRLP